MKVNFRVIGALILIGAIVFMAFNALQPQTYSGEDITFTKSQGQVVVQNATGGPVTAQITSRRTFLLNTDAAGLATIRPTRESINGRFQYVFNGELPDGRVDVRISRGQNVVFNLAGEGPIRVDAYDQGPVAARNIIIIAVLGVLGTLYYASSATGHAWLNSLRRSFPAGAARRRAGASS